MRRMLLTCLATLALHGAPPAAHADVLRFEGIARIELHELLVHGDPYTLAATVVDLEIELHGPQVASQGAYAVGTARIRRVNGSITTIPMYGHMTPPEGGGGFVGGGGLGDDDGLYCFRIWDQVDAPTPRPDRLVAAFEPLSRLAEGHLDDIVAALADPTGGVPLIPTDNCPSLEYRYAQPISGDFWFTTVL